MNTPNTPNTPNIPVLPGQLWTVAKQDVLWLMRHERIVIVALVLVAGVFLGNKWLNYASAQKDAKVAALTLVVNQDKQTVANLALQAAQAQATYQTTLDAITKQNVALEASVAQESTILAQRQATDKALALPAVAQRIEILVPVAVGGITATTSGIVMNDTAAHATLNVLEQVPTLASQLASETQVAQNNADLVTKSQAVNADLNKEVAALNMQIGDQTKQCKAEVASEKAKTKKAFIKGLKYGFVAGFAAGAYIMHAL